LETYMSNDEKPPARKCDEFQLLMMRELDGEISPKDKARLAEHLKTCAGCAREYKHFGCVATATAEVSMREVSAEEWDFYWRSVYNRLERGIAWILVSIGAVVALTYAGFSLVMYLVHSEAMALWAEAGVLVLALGVAWLFVSVVREKLTLRKTDKYRGVRR
jgi:predicted anti-sigma-YlaC factor YlaD